MVGHFMNLTPLNPPPLLRPDGNLSSRRILILGIYMTVCTKVYVRDQCPGRSLGIDMTVDTIEFEFQNMDPMAVVYGLLHFPSPSHEQTDESR